MEIFGVVVPSWVLIILIVLVLLLVLAPIVKGFIDEVNKKK